MSEFDSINLSPEIELQMPQKCLGCPIQCELKTQVGSLLFEKHLAESVGGSLVGEMGERFDAMVESQLPEEEAEQIKQSARQAVSKGIDNIDSEIASTRQEIDSNVLSCNGVLKMRAAKAGIRYTVSVCTSRRVYLLNGDKPEHAPAHIKAELED